MTELEKRIEELKREIPIQKASLYLGRWGCYIFSILYLAKKLEDVLEQYYLFLANSWIRWDCFVLNPGAILSHLTGVNYTVRHEGLDYFPKKNELEILRYEKEALPNPAHFVVGDGASRVVFDPSDALKRGKWRQVSKRIFRRHE